MTTSANGQDVVLKIGLETLSDFFFVFKKIHYLKVFDTHFLTNFSIPKFQLKISHWTTSLFKDSTTSDNSHDVVLKILLQAFWNFFTMTEQVQDLEFFDTYFLANFSIRKSDLKISDWTTSLFKDLTTSANRKDVVLKIVLET